MNKIQNKQDIIAPLGICAIFRNEALYLKEWIEFHQIVGVTKFFLYNNRSNDNWREVLQPYMDSGLVDVKEWDYDVPCQLSAYQDFIDRANRSKVWIAFIDCDEFLFSPANKSVADILAAQIEPMAIGVNWMCFGNGGHDKYDPRPVIERFHLRPIEEGEINATIKCIIRMDQTVEVGTTPHYFEAASATVNERGDRITDVIHPHKSKLLRINHYKTKSKEEWFKREKLGKPDLVRPMDFKTFDELSGTEVDDRTIQKFLPELKERLGL